MKSFLITLCLVSVSAVLFAGFVFSYMFFGASPYSGTVEIRIEQGEPFSAVVRKLREHKVVSNEKLFSLWARYSGSEKKIHWGLYRFELPLSPSEVLSLHGIGEKGSFSVSRSPKA
jgi:cell division protein YceG involved in septum cleavage